MFIKKLLLIVPNLNALSIHPWHVVMTKPRQEFRALQNLEQQGFNVFLPLINKEVMRRRTLDHEQEPLFKRYLFVQFDEVASPWHVIRNTMGVSKLVRFGEEPAVVPDEVIHALQMMQRPEQPLLNQGEILLVTEGPFKSLEVIFQMRDGEARAHVLMELLNKTHKVSLALNTLKRAG